MEFDEESREKKAENQFPNRVTISETSPLVVDNLPHDMMSIFLTVDELFEEQLTESVIECE